MVQLSFDDAVTAGYLPSNELYGVYYCDGKYANLSAVRRRLPHATLYAITVFGRTGAGVFACDCEQGDLTPEQAVEWVDEQIKFNVPLICVYASADTWLGAADLWGKLEAHGPRIKRWVADYNDVKSTTITYNGRTETFDAHQYNSDPRLDYDVAADGFFTPFKPRPKKRKPSFHYNRFAWRPRRLAHGVHSPRAVVKYYDILRHHRENQIVLDKEWIDTQDNLFAVIELYRNHKIKSKYREWCEGQLRARLHGSVIRPSL
jgi:hypothetical protein